MKLHNLTTLALLGGALIVPGYAEKVQFEQLPAPLQQKIRSQVGSARIEDIDRDTRNGKTTYEVAFKNAQGENTELVFEDSGNLAGAGAATVDSRKITYKELPVPVRRTADAQISGGEVNDVERRVRDGRVLYGIGFKGANGTGPQRELVIDAQGKLLRGARPGVAAASTTPVPNRPNVSRPVRSAAVPTRTIKFNELPQSVRQVAEARLSHGNVERVERKVQNGEIDYTLLFKKDDGQYQQMVITEDGKVVSHQLLDAAAVGAAGAIQSDVSKKE